MIYFKLWLENEESHESIDMEIPMPDDILILNDLFKKHNKKLYAVGGVVRDFLVSHFHYGGKGGGPKDVDLTTDATPDEITEILQSPDAIRNEIKVLPKGAAFGVISAVIDGKEYEIATFREEYYDPIAGDGRRPDKVSFSTADKDASRRDLTMNALFYDIDNKKIIDYNTINGKGQGIDDIKNLIARPVGNPYERFREDKLRVLRLIRFFCRFNAGSIMNELDKDTLGAIDKYKRLEGISAERIVSEFMSGFKSAVSKKSYFKNYEELDLFPAVLPGLKVNIEGMENVKSFPASLSFLLRDNQEPMEVRKKLSALKYINDISDKVELMLKILKMERYEIIPLIKRKEVLIGSKDDILDLAVLTKNELIHKFANYQQQTNSRDFMHLKGREIALAMDNKEKELFTSGH